MKKFSHHLQIVNYLATCQENLKHSMDKRIVDMLIAYAYHINMRTLSCFPSQDRIAAMAGLSQKTVKKYTDQLTDLGVIKVTSRAQQRLTNIYKFNLKKLTDWIYGLTSLSIERINNNNSLPTVDEIKVAALAATANYQKGVNTVREKILFAFKSKKPTKVPAKPTGHHSGDMYQSDKVGRTDKQQTSGDAHVANLRAMFGFRKKKRGAV